LSVYIHGDAFHISRDIAIAIYCYSAQTLILVLPSHRGRRLSRPGWLVTYQGGLPGRSQSLIQVLTRPGVE